MTTVNLLVFIVCALAASTAVLAYQFHKALLQLRKQRVVLDVIRSSTPVFVASVEATVEHHFKDHHAA